MGAPKVNPIGPSTTILAEEVSSEASMNVVVKHWNNAIHVLIDSRHVYAGSELECQAYMSGLLKMFRLMRKKSIAQ